MKPTFLRTQAFSLKYAFVAADGLSELRCRACQGVVETHQPNPGLPERILATCPQCGLWYLIEELGDSATIMIVELPDPSEIPHPARPLTPT